MDLSNYDSAGRLSLDDLNELVSAASAELNRLQGSLIDTPNWRIFRRRRLWAQIHETRAAYLHLIRDQDRAFDREFPGYRS